MSQLPTSSASRLRAPSWRDSRLLVGVLLVILSTVLGAVVVARADDRVPVYTATGFIAPGEQVTAASVTVARVQLGDLEGRYLSAREELPPDTYALRGLSAGELVPVAGVGEAAAVEVQPISLLVDAVSAAALSRGDRVDVYVNRPDGSEGVVRQTFAGPEQVLSAVAVVAVAEEDSVIGGADQTRAVRVAVPRDAVRDLVGDVDLGARITLVPVPSAPAEPAS
ncbi:hypothetical protein KC207_11355 [Phycicoccus sp. BSK3Z-2]|uniref:SAF domain-containing protein n=1 Tax=Phycicoccus avicenniae TaxID=2828860 RepID=A0A941I0A8_9MICO|nr:hypothetical protein [Phycicoccus avicenniae]MBR7743887.1 hypothetical protein [Phycicoccus avicenniae]